MTTTIEREAPAAAPTYDLYINGEWRPAASGATFVRKSPANGEPVGTFAKGSKEDTEAAIAAARAAFDSGVWSKAPAKTRQQALAAISAELRTNRQRYGEYIAKELGKPIRDAIGEVIGAADVFEYYAGKALDLTGYNVSAYREEAMGLVVRDPVGVCGLIVPWNFPLILLSWKLAPALAVGCTVIIKPSDTTPLCTLELTKFIAGLNLPPGVVNTVTGPGSQVGMTLASHPDVDKVAFTGSTATGRVIMQAATSNMKKISLELGGKSPNIVFADANMDQAVAGAVNAAFWNQGEVCQAGSRLLLEESIHDEFVERLIAETAKLKVGDPLSRDTQMGPVVNEDQLSTVENYVEIGKGEGAKLLAGGHRLTGEGYDGGLYYAPTIFDGVTNDMRIAQEEIFGPVLGVLTFKNVDDAIAIGNDSIYGLAAGIWTENVNTMMKVFKGLKAGSIYGNCYHGAGLTHLPFGGYKQSGIGRELGQVGLDAFTEVKALHLRLR